MSNVNRCIVNGTFLENLRNADITQIFEEFDRLLKSDY